MKQLVFIIIIIIIIIVLLAGCAASSVDPATPPTIVYGEDVCDRCGMIIEDERFAAGVVVAVREGHYEHRIFDDIGDMLAYAADKAAQTPIHAYYVHDYDSKNWIDGETAFYVRSSQIHSPMGYGLAAFAEQSSAEMKAAEWEGEVIELSTLQQEIGD
ncbi:MAG: nitrous oxide reductase accessory protein NosL [Caldilineaceae bacterium]